MLTADDGEYKSDQAGIPRWPPIYDVRDNFPRASMSFIFHHYMFILRQEKYLSALFVPFVTSFL